MVEEMKICFLAHNPFRDTAYGIDKYSYEIIEYIEKNSLKTVVCVEGRLTSRGKWIREEMFYPLKLKGIKADVFHALSQNHAKAAILMRKRPLVTTIHDLVPFRNSLTNFYEHSEPATVSQMLNYKYMQLCTLLAAKYSDKIIVPFEVTKRDLILTLGTEADKIEVIPYGVNTEFFRPLDAASIRLRFKDFGDKKIILFVGGVTKAKGFDVLINAVEKAVRDYPNLLVWIVGKWKLFDGEEFVKRHNLKDRVVFFGHIAETELPLYYNRADIFVFPSKVGFCLQILEAIACKTAVITADTDDIKSIVGDAVITNSPLDMDAIAENILRLLKNDDERAELAEKGYGRARGLTWELTAKRTLEVYRSLSV